MFGAVVARSEAQTARLATLYAVLDGKPAIEPPHLEAALALWRYCAELARYIFGDATGDPVADQILRLLRERMPDGMTRTEISALFNRNQSSERLSGALALLIRHGLARLVSRSGANGRGRPVTIWCAT